MDKSLTPNELLPEISNKIYIQDYSSKATIDGVKIINLTAFVNEDGDFSEVMRLNSQGQPEKIPDFQIAQINRSKLNPGTIKAWHIHLKQDEIWYVAPQDELLLGLWDVRQKSSSRNLTMRIMLGGGVSRLVYIPRGVAHGAANFNRHPVQIYYLVSAKFNLRDPDERRLPWDSLGADFWQPKKD